MAEGEQSKVSKHYALNSALPRARIVGVTLKGTGQHKHQPRDVRAWPDGLSTAVKFQTSADQASRIYRTPLMYDMDEPCRDELPVMVELHSTVFRWLNHMLRTDKADLAWELGQRSSGFSSTKSESEMSKATAQPDISLRQATSTGIGYLIPVEVKHPCVLGFQEGALNTAPDLCKIWRNDDGRGKLSKDESKIYANVRNCISQVYEQMVQGRCWYGVLSTYLYTWVLKRDSENEDILHISQPIPYDQAGPLPTVRGTMAWLVKQELATIERPTKTILVLDSASDGDAPSQPSPGDKSCDDQDGDMDYKPPKFCLNPTSPAVLRSRSANSGAGANESALAGVRQSHLILGDLLGWGAGGVVFNAEYAGQPAAIKLIHAVEGEGRHGHLWESEVYAKLRSLQGTVVPMVLGQGYAEAGYYFWLALSKIDGSTLADYPTPFSESVRSAAVEALQQIHALGVLHGDIRLENMMVQSPSNTTMKYEAEPDEQLASGSAACRPRVVVLDFERSRLGPVSDVEFGREKQQLLQLLQ